MGVPHPPWVTYLCSCRGVQVKDQTSESCQSRNSHASIYTPSCAMSLTTSTKERYLCARSDAQSPCDASVGGVRQIRFFHHLWWERWHNTQPPRNSTRGSTTPQRPSPPPPPDTSPPPPYHPLPESDHSLPPRDQRQSLLPPARPPSVCCHAPLPDAPPSMDTRRPNNNNLCHQYHESV